MVQFHGRMGEGNLFESNAFLSGSNHLVTTVSDKSEVETLSFYAFPEIGNRTDRTMIFVPLFSLKAFIDTYCSAMKIVFITIIR